MKSSFTAVLFATALAASAPLAAAPEKGEFALLHALSTIEANRIVGLWATQVEFGPCAGGPRTQARGLNLFHAGGTVSETAGAPGTVRGPGFGSWSYDRASATWSARMQFYRFLPDGSVDGISDAHREIALSDDGSRFTDALVTRVLNTDGSLRVELCGSIVGTRVPLD